MGTMGGMSAVIAGGPAVYALMPPLGCVLCHAWVSYWKLPRYRAKNTVLGTYRRKPVDFRARIHPNLKFGWVLAI